MIELRAIGTARIQTSNSTLTPSQSVVFAAALYLIVERGKPVSRAGLSALLWPNVPRDAQAHRLRQTLYQLRTLGISVEADRQVLRLTRGDVITDFDGLSTKTFSALESGGLVECLPHYTPQLSDGFQEWLDSFRESVHAALTRRLLSALKTAREAGKWEEVEQTAQYCLRLDAYNEAAVLARAEAYAMRGQKATAVSILDRHIEDLGQQNPSLTLPATILRKRVLQNTDRASGPTVATSEPEFVGRAAEMVALTTLMAKALRGSGGGCLIEGNPGIGKTRISAELAAFAKLQGVRVMRVACKRADADQPLSAFVTLVPQLRELPGALGCSQSSLFWLKRLTEFDPSAQELPASADDSATLYTHLRLAVFDLLDAVSEERCLLVVVEDVQWLDRPSAKLFGAILEWAASKRILLVFNSREASNSLMDAVSSNQITIIHLPPLASNDALTLIRTTIGASRTSVEEGSIAWLIDTGDGNPYFIQELTKHWIESGQRYDIPASVASVLDERISRLSNSARQLLQACAVLGEHSNVQRLEQVLNFAAQDFLTGIQELSTGGMLRATDGPATQNLFVRHDLLSTEILNTLAPPSLAFLHRRCGVVLEREALGHSVSISLMRACAFHWYHSGDSERAHDLALKCADHLLEIGLAADAATAFEGALSFSFSVQRQLEVLGRIIHAHRMAGDHKELLRTIHRYRSLQAPGSSDAQHDDIEILEFDALRTTETELTSVQARARACVSDTSLPVGHRLKAAVAAIKLTCTRVDMAELERIYRTIEPILEDPGVDVRARLQIRVIYNTMTGDLREGLRFAKERVQLERTEGSTSLLINAMTDLAYVLRRTGPVEEMFAVLEEAHAIAMEHRHYAQARDCAEKLGSLLEDEELAGSKAWMELAATEVKEPTQIASSFSFNADAVRIALRENCLEEARRILETGFDWEWLKQRHMWLAAVLALRVRLLIAESSKPAEVSQPLERLQDLYEITASLGRQDYEVAALVEGLVYIGKQHEAKACFEDFVFRRRRDLTPVSRELSTLSQAFGVTRHSTSAMPNPEPRPTQRTDYSA